MPKLDSLFWIKTTDRLPPEKKYVLGIYAGTNWHDSDDPKGVNFVVVKLVYGISIKERERMGESNARKRRYTFGDEHGNNLRPYEWNTFGPSQFFGQDISYWMYIP